MNEKAVKIIRNTLTAFVFVTIGFALGKEMTLRSVRHSAPDTAFQSALSEKGQANRVMVYYLHATFRCVTCNTIEKMTAELLKNQFGDAMKSGVIEWKEADFQKEEKLAKRYAVISSCVVVVNIRDEKEVDFKRLDEVWTLISNREAFDKYVGDAIRGYLMSAGGAAL